MTSKEVRHECNKTWLKNQAKVRNLVMLIMALEFSPVRLRALTLSPRSTYVGVCLPIGCVRVVSLGSQGCLKVLSGENGLLWEQPH